MRPLSDPLVAIAELARVTGDVAHSFYKPGIAAEYKGDGSPVTAADRAAEAAARDWLAANFPDDDILGEEFGGSERTSTRRWIVDPIDGTKSFMRHVPLWGTIVALEEDGQVIAGAAYFPALAEMVAAATGAGCWYNGQRCAVSETSELKDATVLTTDDRFPGSERRRSRWGQLAAGAAVARTWGDAYGYLLVATGRADVMVDDASNPWDAAPMLPLIVEAGGVFTDFRGSQTAYGGDMIATNRALSQEVRLIMGES